MTPRAPRRDAAANRAALLDAARSLLRRDPDAPAEAIAAEAGLSRRSFYGHFTGRDELIAAVLTAGAERVTAALADAVDAADGAGADDGAGSAGSAAGASSAAGACSADSAAAESADATLVWLARTAARLWGEVSHMRVMAQLAVRGSHSAEVAAALRPLRTALRRRVEHGVASGEIRADLPPATTARLIEAAVLDVLDEAVEHDYNDVVGRRTAMLAALSTAGLGWREAGELIDRTPELAD